MPAPNDVGLVNVFTRDAGGAISNQVFSIANDLEIVVELEAGSTIYGGGTQYETGVVVRDLSKNEVIPTDPASYGPEAMGPSGEWDPQKDEFVYTVKAGDIAGRANNVCEAIAWLKARVADQDVSFATSPRFILV